METVEVKQTAPFKLKDRVNQGIAIFDLQKQFGFMPKKIIIQKLRGHNNTLVLSAVVENDEDRKKNEALVERQKKTNRRGPNKREN